jgi:hypothetical protein
MTNHFPDGITIILFRASLGFLFTPDNAAVWIGVSVSLGLFAVSYDNCSDMWHEVTRHSFVTTVDNSILFPANRIPAVKRRVF